MSALAIVGVVTLVVWIVRPAERTAEVATSVASAPVRVDPGAIAVLEVPEAHGDVRSDGSVAADVEGSIAATKPSTPPGAPISRADQLRWLLADFDNAMKGPHDDFAISRAQMALCCSIATILDAAGRWEQVPSTPSSDGPKLTGRSFSTGARVYTLADGEFPEYDVLLQHQSRLMELNSSRKPGDPPPDLPAFDAEFIEIVRARVAEALNVAGN